MEVELWQSKHKILVIELFLNMKHPECSLREHYLLIIERIFAQVEEEGAWIKSWKTLGASEEQKAKEAKKAVFKKQHILDIYMPLIVTGWPNTIYYRIFLKNRSFYH